MGVTEAVDPTDEADSSAESPAEPDTAAPTPAPEPAIGESAGAGLPATVDPAPMAGAADSRPTVAERPRPRRTAGRRAAKRSIAAVQAVEAAADKPAATEPVPPPLPVLGEPPGRILAADAVATAARKAMWIHVARMLEREPSILDPDAPDDMRKYRVAVRRLRAATRLFRDALPGRELRSLRRDLSQLADAIGALRDLELRIADLARWSAERSAGSEGVAVAVQPLIDAWTAERAHLRADLAAEIASRRHRRLLVKLAELVEATDDAEERGMGDVVADRVASRLWTAYEDLRAYARVVRWADLETLHQLRIAAKRLRDSLDLLGDVVGPSRVLLTDRLVALQDHLGATNDAAVTARAVRAFLEGRHQRLTAAEGTEIAAYLADRERTVARLRRGVGRPWRAVDGITFARRLSRLVLIRPSAPTRG
jgi:CHAD domain-containing protein